MKINLGSVRFAKTAAVCLAVILSYSAFATAAWRHGEREALWPEGKIPDFQPHQIGAMTDEVSTNAGWRAAHQMPYVEWFEAPTNANGGCMILVSGGSYQCCCDVGLVKLWKETFTKLGYQTVNLVYRTPRAKDAPFYRTGWQDGQRAVRLVRSEAKKRGFDPEKIGVIGMSAGGHLVTMLATSALTPAYQKVDALDETPCHVNWCIANAPAYNSVAAAKGGVAAPQDGTTQPASGVAECFAFDAKTCPISFHHGAADPYTPNGSARCYRELRKRKIPSELHLYADKPHGAFGLERAVEFMNQMQFCSKLEPEVKLMDRYPNDDARASYEKEPVWPEGKMPDVQTNQCTPYIEWHLPKTLKTKAIQIVYSGGGYGGNSPDGFEVAPMRRYLNEKGMAVVTMKYRTPRPLNLPKHVTAWQDLQRAIRIVRSKAAAKGLDPDRIGIMGSSAGGHLTLMGVTSSKTPAYQPIDDLDKLSCTVQWAIAIYPAYALTDGAERPNAQGGNEDSSVLVPEFKFDDGTCPTVFIHGDADGWAAMNSVKTWEKMRTMGIQSELHTLATRNHCFQSKASPGTGSYTWMDRAWDFLSAKKFNLGGPSLLARAIPLPEHPRPDWERADWVNLNGEWDFGFAPNKLDRKILVPFGWGSPASGVKDEGDTGYYRRSVTVPKAWKGKRVFVIVGASDHDTTCAFAGETLGSYSGGYVPFEFELTEFVKWGEAQALEFKVWDPSNKTAREGHYLYGKQGYGNARGIWQTVYLEARGQDYLDSVRLEPVIATDPKFASTGVLARVTLAAPAKVRSAVTLKVGEVTKRVDVYVGCQKLEAFVELANPRLWTLEDPYLYDVTLKYGDDVVKSYVGLRQIGVDKNPNGDSYVTLNGKPIYLQMCLDQSYHPEGWYTFPSDEVMKNEILISKKLALSGNRVHIKVEVPRKLYWADKLGVLIQADVPCAWGDAGEKMFEEHWKCFEAMVKRDFNHPSIYQWTLFNETWGLFNNRSLSMGLASGNGGKKRVYRASTQRRVAAAYQKAKALDSTRIVEDNSPCNNDHVVTDVNTWHSYCPGYRWEETVAYWCNMTAPGATHNYIGGNVQNGAPMMNSECGNVWGYQGSTGDCDFTWDYHLMMNAFRRHLKCGGWLYTEHHDVINEWNGYVRFDRTWKETGLEELADMTLADFHREAAIFFAGTPGRETGELLAPGQTVTVPVGVSFTTGKYAGRSLTLKMSCRFVDDNGVPVESQLSEVGLPKMAKSWQCEKLWDIGFESPKVPVCGRLVFELNADGRPIAKNFWSYGVTNAVSANVVASKLEWSDGTATVLDGIKLNGFGKGFFEFELVAPAEGGTFRAELSSKRKNAKDFSEKEQKGGLDYMLGGGTAKRSKNPNSYPQTSAEKFSANLKVYANGELIHTQVLPDDPADHRGILSWLSQPHDGKLSEAGSYGYPVEAKIPASAVKNGKVTIRLESDHGLAVYGPRFGRYPHGLQIRP